MIDAYKSSTYYEEYLMRCFDKSIERMVIVLTTVTLNELTFNPDNIWSVVTT